MNPSVQRWPGVVILTGPALRTALECALITIKHRSLSGLTNRPYEELARELHAAMTAAGQSDDRATLLEEALTPEQPTVTINEAATRLRLSPRQTRRLAPQLGGQHIAGRWLIDEIALREHIEGQQWTAKSRPAS